jgi:hypothetical protein
MGHRKGNRKPTTLHRAEDCSTAVLAGFGTRQTSFGEYAGRDDPIGHNDCRLYGYARCDEHAAVAIHAVSNPCA